MPSFDSISQQHFGDSPAVLITSWSQAEVYSQVDWISSVAAIVSHESARMTRLYYSKYPTSCFLDLPRTVSPSMLYETRLPSSYHACPATLSPLCYYYLLTNLTVKVATAEGSKWKTSHFCQAQESETMIWDTSFDELSYGPVNARTTHTILCWAIYDPLLSFVGACRRA